VQVGLLPVFVGDYLLQSSLTFTQRARELGYLASAEKQEDNRKNQGPRQRAKSQQEYCESHIRFLSSKRDFILRASLKKFQIVRGSA